MHPLPRQHVPVLEAALWERWRGKCSWTARRDALAASLALCGLRWEEVVRVRVCDIDPAGFLAVHSAKGGAPRCLSIGENLSAALLAFAACVAARFPPKGRRSGSRSRLHVGPCGPGCLFVSRRGKGLAYSQSHRALGVLTSRLLGHAYSFHCLRHTAAVRVYEATHDVLAVQRLLGHRSLAATLCYLRGIEVVGLAGLPAFCGDSARAGVRLFEPVIEAAAAVAAGREHQCLAHQVPTIVQRDDGPALRFACEVCGRFLGYLPCGRVHQVQPGALDSPPGAGGPRPPDLPGQRPLFA